MDIKNLRKYGINPYRVAVIHGGPGANGEMASLARNLSSFCGILEPLQTAETLDGQVIELKTVLENHGDLPITLVGFSWGAWLSYIVAAKYPSIVNKLLLVGSGPFEEKYAENIHKVRLDRLSSSDLQELNKFMKALEDPDSRDINDKNNLFKQLGNLISKADVYDPVEYDDDIIDCRFDIFESVWKDAAALRKSGELLTLSKHIKCPVIAIHGDYDPHPVEGVVVPLTDVLKNFRCIQLKDCGHKPWIERQAGRMFYQILKDELGNVVV